MIADIPLDLLTKAHGLRSAQTTPPSISTPHTSGRMAAEGEDSSSTAAKSVASVEMESIAPEIVDPSKSSDPSSHQNGSERVALGLSRREAKRCV